MYAFQGEDKIEKASATEKENETKNIPRTYEEVQTSANRLQWLKAIGDEFATLKKQCTWTLVR